MNKYIYSAAALMTLSMLTLTSCQDEVEQVGNPVGHEVLLRVSANRGDAATRTTLEPDGAGNLECKWQKDDQLMVVDSNGKKIGIITIVDGIDSAKGTFEGKVNLEGQDNISLVYLGTATNAETYAVDATSLTINLSEQDGTLASLTNKDVLTSSSHVVDNFYSSDEVTIENVTLNRQLAFGHFTLDFDDDVTLDVGDVITITGDGLRSEGKVNFRNGGSVPDNSSNYSGSTSITITKAEKGNDFYVSMFPYGNVTPTFTLVKNGVTYTGSLGVHNWVTGEFVRAGEKQGVAITMAKEAAIDHSVNPLAKWAEYDLVYNSTTGVSTLATDYKTRSSLYQWGNNKGWTNWAEVESTGFNVYNMDGKAISNSKTRKPTATDNMYMYPLKNVTGLRRYFNMNCSFSTSDYPEDYWPLAERQNDDWEARAKAYGYTSNLYNGNYRLPSSSDYEMILPSNLDITSASTLINGISELKKFSDYNVQFNWKVVDAGNEIYILQIKALVVSKLVTEVDESLWSDPNVVTRNFGGTGYINNMAITCYIFRAGTGGYKASLSSTGANLPNGYGGWTFVGSQKIINPMPYGTCDLYADRLSNGNVEANIENVVDVWKNNGHYWTSDGYSMGFAYDPQNKYDQGSYLRLKKDDKSKAYALRIIIDD